MGRGNGAEYSTIFNSRVSRNAFAADSNSRTISPLHQFTEMIPLVRRSIRNSSSDCRFSWRLQPRNACFVGSAASFRASYLRGMTI
jgi:hypothetical protein